MRLERNEPADHRLEGSQIDVFYPYMSNRHATMVRWESVFWTNGLTSTCINQHDLK